MVVRSHSGNGSPLSVLPLRCARFELQSLIRLLSLNESRLVDRFPEITILRGNGMVRCRREPRQGTSH